MTTRSVKKLTAREAIRDIVDSRFDTLTSDILDVCGDRSIDNSRPIFSSDDVEELVAKETGGAR